MRCPKCDARFVVHQDGTVGALAAAPPAPPSLPPAKFGKPVSVAPSSPGFSVDDPGVDGPADLFAGDSDAQDELADLPAPKRPAPPSPKVEEFEVDLPAPVVPAATHAQPDEVDLPAPLSPRGATLADEIDLPAPKIGGSQGSFPSEIDLPAPIVGGAHGSDGDEVDLPAPKIGGAPPPPLPAGGHVDLPRPVQEEVDLPMAMTDAELPAPSRAVHDLPVPRPDLSGGATAGSLDGGSLFEDASPDENEPLFAAPTPGEFAPEEPGSGAFPSPDLGLLDDAPGAPPPPGLDLDMGEPPAGGLELDLGFGDDDGAPPPPPPGGDTPQTDGPVEFAELDLAGGDDGLEFDLPDEAVDVVPGALPARPRPRRPAKEIKPPRPAWVVPAAVSMLAVIAILATGFGLASTKHGLFGMHTIEQYLPSYGDDAEIVAKITQAEKIAATDSFADANKSRELLNRQLAQNGVHRRLLARVLLHESLFQMRFGDDADSARTAGRIRRTLQERGDDAPDIDIALAAFAVAKKKKGKAKSSLADALRTSPKDPFVSLVSGELALQGGDARKAATDFNKALANGAGARAQWGIARAYLAANDKDQSRKAVQATLQMSPNHLAARNARAVSLLADSKADEAYALLEPVVNADVKEVSKIASDRELATAVALVALVQEQRGRRGLAREAYARAAKLDPKNVKATIGAGRMLLGEGQHQQALTKFRAIINAGVSGEPDATGKPADLVRAKLGASEALLAMGRPRQAGEVMRDLKSDEPKSPEVELAFGRVAEARKDGGGAVRHYRNAIRLNPKAFRPYMALSQYYSITGRTEEAFAVLVEAEKHVDATAEVRRLRGEAELKRNRVDDAIREFKAALKMEPNDSAARFGLAGAYRKKGQLDRAAESLAKVAEADATFPGLALERGKLAEARGEIDEAVANYRSALSHSPKDLSLKSRLGAALVIAGKLDESEKLLKEVLVEQPFSAEAEHYLGRISLARDRLPRARDRFMKAARLDPQNGTYRMYVGWAALESNDLSEAMREFKAALERDPRLGDAYWLRARLRVRMGAVQDALSDLKKALKLNPARVDAHATMADCYDQLGKDRDAIREYQEALSYDDKRPLWWARLGRLYDDVGETGKSVVALRKAVSMADAQPGTPAWLAESHRLLGDYSFERRQKSDAIVHYGRYLELAPRSALDRDPIEARLRELGVKFHEEP